MTDWPLNIVRDAVRKMKPYSARGGATLALHLDANENPYAPPPVKGATDYNRYPEQQPTALRQRLADLYGVKSNQLMVGRGADEGIEVLLRCIIEDGRDNILICSPTFGYYKTVAQIQNAGIVDVPMLRDDHGNYTWNSSEIIKTAKATNNLKAVFVCSPNNPTGNVISDDLVEQLCTVLPDTIIVVDEAYQEFSDRKSYITQIKTTQNLMVLRTLSKAYALAGVRGGVAIADPRLIDVMLTVLPPYPIARPVENAILAALSPAAMSTHAARLEETLEQRERMFAELQKSPFIEKVYPSNANFLLLDIKDDESLMRELSKRQVKIRDYRASTGHMRISIGSPSENDTALAAFSVEIPSKRPDRIGEIHRTTKETDISVRVNLDDAKLIKVDTGIGFYDHMLEALAKHGNFGLSLTCKGDLEIDGHHTIEDVALALGSALKNALGDKAGAGRFGFVMPMDETQARVAVDLSGRPAMTFKGEFPTDHVGEFAAEMCPHVFQSLSQTLGAAIQIEVKGENTHHMIEACFKGVARALRPAFARSGSEIASTKGVI